MLDFIASILQKKRQVVTVKIILLKTHVCLQSVVLLDFPLIAQLSLSNFPVLLLLSWLPVTLASHLKAAAQLHIY